MSVEVTVGIKESQSLTFEVDQEAAEVATTLREAVTASDGLLDLTDSKGNQILVPVASVAFVQIKAEPSRRVGFGV